MCSFEMLGLREELLQAVTKLGYENPTAIQEQAIPALMAGRDVMGQAQTGTGKTAAFALPMLHALTAETGKVQGLVIAPTRELANQVARAIHEYGQYRNVQVLPVYGGQSYSRQIRRLADGVDVVVGTPGRMLDLIAKGSLDLSHVRFLVLDEADEMLSMGFIEDIESLLSQTPETRQTALFSATLPQAIRTLADRYMRAPEAIMVNPKQMTVENVEQRYYLVHEKDKLAALNRLIETENMTSALIFSRTKIGAAKLAEALLSRGILTEALHGDLDQGMRETVLRRFRNNNITMLVATDVAARGLDIDDVSHVINYDLPLDAEQYVHRIGRTGRAGKTGIAVSLVTPPERWRLRKIEQYTRRQITQAQLPTTAQVLVRRDDLFMDRMADQMNADQLIRERTLVEKLVAAGCDPLDIAAAAIQLARSEETQRPIAEISVVQDAPRRPAREYAAKDKYADKSQRERRPRRHGQEPGMVRLSLNVGKALQLRPGEIVGAIASTANIPGKAIGAIEIRNSQTFVDVAEKHVNRVLDKMRHWKLRGQTITLQRAD